MQSKLVQKFGNGGHIIVPKEYVGKRIKLVAEPKTIDDIRREVMDIVQPYLTNILGIYLYGSYARNEQTLESDIDILVITDRKISIAKHVEYSIITVTQENIEKTLKKNAILVLPLLTEAKTIINPELIKKYTHLQFTKRNTKEFLEGTQRILDINKEGLNLDFEVGSLVYSLVLRTRGLLMIQRMIKGKHYSKHALFSYLGHHFSQRIVNELYSIYSKERNEERVKESSIIKKIDTQKLIHIAEKLLKDVRVTLHEQEKIQKRHRKHQ